jgi:A/G-specific adenine glycosylase
MPWKNEKDPYKIWISEIILQQTRVQQGIHYYNRFITAFPTAQHIANATESHVFKLWEGLGYYTRVRNMQKAAQQIVEKHCGTFPKNFDAVHALPGIGRYTTGAICSIAFNQPTPILDGNVIRVLTRIFGISENPREKQTNELLWKIAGELVPLIDADRRSRKDWEKAYMDGLEYLGMKIEERQEPWLEVGHVERVLLRRAAADDRELGPFGRDGLVDRDRSGGHGKNLVDLVVCADSVGAGAVDGDHLI